MLLELTGSNAIGRKLAGFSATPFCMYQDRDIIFPFRWKMVVIPAVTYDFPNLCLQNRTLFLMRLH